VKNRLTLETVFYKKASNFQLMKYKNIPALNWRGSGVKETKRKFKAHQETN
jgi:hypothetical protein